MSFSLARLVAICGLSVAPLAGLAAPTLITNALSSMQDNSWLKLNLNTFSSIVPSPSQMPIDTFMSPTSAIYAWSGAAWDSKLGNLYLYGKDYGGYEGNEVYIWNGSTGLWGRGSVASQVVKTADPRPGQAGKSVYAAIDGIMNAPASGETYDNMVYLPNVERLAVLGVSRNGDYWLDPATGVATGPYFWDPAKADPNKVGGTTGSQVNPALYPAVTGGQMWQNRNNVTLRTTPPGWTEGTSDVLSVNGKDVVYLTDGYDNLWRYTVNDLDPANDSWVQIGRRSITGLDGGGGSAAIDTINNLYLRSGTLPHQAPGATFAFWDLDSTVPQHNNRAVLVKPTVVDAGVVAPNFVNFGIEFDSALGVYTLWDGSQYVWYLRPPANLDTNGDGFADNANGWTLDRVDVTGAGPSIPAKYNGVYGKWQYLEDVHAFVGVIDPASGDVFLYKPMAAVPEPATWALLLSGIAAVGSLARRRKA